MKVTICTLFIFLISHATLFSQTIDKLKIDNTEMPKEYSMSETPSCVSIPVCFINRQICIVCFLEK